MARIEKLTHLDLPELAPYVSLTDVALRRAREPEQGIYLAESSKVIARALSLGHHPLSVLVTERWLEHTMSLVADYDIAVYTAPDDEIEKLTGFHLHRGAIAAMQRPPASSLDDVLSDARLVVVLEDLVDHTNVGAIFRAVAGLGADAVLVSPSCADPLYRRSIRVSMGSVLHIPWTRLTTWPKDILGLKSHGFHVAALALDDAATPLRDFVSQNHDRVAIVVGSEGDGLARPTLDLADSIVSIPMHRGIDSLNVASAAAVALYALT